MEKVEKAINTPKPFSKGELSDTKAVNKNAFAALFENNDVENLASGPIPAVPMAVPPKAKTSTREKNGSTKRTDEGKGKGKVGDIVEDDYEFINMNPY